MTSHTNKNVSINQNISKVEPLTPEKVDAILLEDDILFEPHPTILMKCVKDVDVRWNLMQRYLAKWQKLRVMMNYHVSAWNADEKICTKLNNSILSKNIDSWHFSEYMKWNDINLSFFIMFIHCFLQIVT